MKIDKSHSKADLVSLINTINIPVIHSHAHNKKDIQELLMTTFDKDIKFGDNVYGIKDSRDLQVYLCSKNPKQSLSVKEKKAVMDVCKKIKDYCKNGYVLCKSKYNTEQEIEDDMLFIMKYGDLPSVRRSCRLMNANMCSNRMWEPIISPQVKQELDEQRISKKVEMQILGRNVGEFLITFD
jgi:hypothetical protein